MRVKSLPSPTYLHKRLRYEPGTGKLFWRHCAEMPKQWNTRYAGTEALACIGKNGYRSGAIDGIDGRYAHVVIWALVTGKWPKDEIDHDNRNRADNRIRNLRPATRRENMQNQKLYHTSTCGVAGVHWDVRSQRWKAHIGLAGKQVTLGRFTDFDGAVAARRAAEVAHGFHPQHGR